MLLATEELDGAAAHRIGLVQRLGDLARRPTGPASIADLAPLTIAAHKLGLERLADRADDPDYARPGSGRGPRPTSKRAWRRSRPDGSRFRGE